jgi:uroporphyrinogen-III synthase
VVVTRARAQASALVDALRRLGAGTVEVPAIEIADPDDGGVALRDAAGRLGSYDWVVLTSPNGAQRLLDAVRDLGGDGRSFAGARLAAIGPGTAEALAAGNLSVDLVPERFVAESLLDAFPDPPPGGGRVLLARAAVARDVLPEGLRERGWDVDVVEAYRTVAAPLTDTQREAAAAADVITFTSSSTVERFLDAAGAGRRAPGGRLHRPVTAATARRHGLDVTVEADVHTIDGLVDALVAWALANPVPNPVPR